MTNGFDDEPLSVREEIAIRVKEGDQVRMMKIEAALVGKYFAVHRTVNRGGKISGNKWTATHRNTGYSVNFGYNSCAAAFRACKSLERIGGNLWECEDAARIKTKFSPEQLRRIAYAAYAEAS